MIELIGLPGSGKTTLVNKMLEENEEAYNPLNKYIYRYPWLVKNIIKIGLTFLYAIEERKSFRENFQCIKKIKFPNYVKKIKMYSYFFSTLYIVRKNRNNDNCIIDEGMITVILGISICTKQIDENLKILMNNIKPFLGQELLFLDTGEKEIYSRLLNRTGGGGAELRYQLLEGDSYSLTQAYIFLNTIMKYLEITDTVKIIKEK